VKIDYSTYSLKDLVDVKSRIDEDRFPENYHALMTELDCRRRSGNFDGAYSEPLNFFDDQEDDEDKSLVIEFSTVGHKKRRVMFVAAFLIFNAVMLAIVIPKYFVTSLDKLNQYNTSVSSIKCLREEVENEETDAVSVYYDLNVTSHDDQFIAFDVGKYMCEGLTKDYKTGDKITVWHSEGIIYQLKSESRMLLSYQYLTPRIRAIQTQDSFFNWAILLVVWIGFFKSLVNAVAPSTFTKD